MLNRRVLETNGINVALNVIHADQRLIQSESHPLRVPDSHEQKTNQTGADCDGNSVDAIPCNVSAPECLTDDRHDLVQMFTRSQLRHDTTESFVRLDLRSDYRRNDFAAIAYDCGCCLIARSFDTEYEHVY